MKTKGGKIFPLLAKNLHTVCVAHSYSFRGQSGRVKKEHTHVHQAQRLRMDGAIPLLPPLCLHGVGPAQTGVYDTLSDHDFLCASLHHATTAALKYVVK